MITPHSLHWISTWQTMLNEHFIIYLNLWFSISTKVKKSLYFFYASWLIGRMHILLINVFDTSDTCLHFLTDWYIIKRLLPDIQGINEPFVRQKQSSHAYWIEAFYIECAETKRKARIRKQYVLDQQLGETYYHTSNNFVWSILLDEYKMVS